MICFPNLRALAVEIGSAAGRPQVASIVAFENALIRAPLPEHGGPLFSKIEAWLDGLSPEDFETVCWETSPKFAVIAAAPSGAMAVIQSIAKALG